MIGEFGKMNVLIVEDEIMARRSLSNTLKRLYPEMDIIGETGSVTDTVAWLADRDNRPDLIFMDVELSDGNCFEIFRRADVRAPVIMTTAYDNYAVKAFEVESTDYILKPIEPEALKRAVDRALARISANAASSVDNGRNVSVETRNDVRKDPEKPSRERFLIRLNDIIVPVKVSDIAYFYSEDKSTHIVTSDARKYVADFSLDIAMEQLDGRRFFRISRNCIVAMSAISNIVKMGSRYMVTASPAASFEMMVSRSKTEDFISWLEGE